jgi:uncharacterized protein YuzE
MRITYFKEDDILNIELSKGEIVRDVSYGWNVNIGFTALGIAEITILDAQANGYYPLEHLTPDHQA